MLRAEARDGDPDGVARGVAQARARRRGSSLRSRSGASTSTTPVARPNQREPLGMQSWVPVSASGRTGTPASTASEKAPSLKGRSAPSTERLPSGNIMTESPSWSVRLALGEHRVHAPGVAAPERDVPREAHGPAGHRRAKELFFSDPAHVPGEPREEERVRDRLMVAHDDVGARADVGRRRPADLEVPERREALGDARHLPERAPRVARDAVARVNEARRGQDGEPRGDARPELRVGVGPEERVLHRSVMPERPPACVRIRSRGRQGSSR